jgi:hypothetical protein
MYITCGDVSKATKGIHAKMVSNIIVASMFQDHCYNVIQGHCCNDMMKDMTDRLTDMDWPIRCSSLTLRCKEPSVTGSNVLRCKLLPLPR